MSDFKTELSDLINRHSKETDPDTPDHILATYLESCLDAFTAAIKARDAATGRIVTTRIKR